MAYKLWFILMYLRKATTQDIFGEVFRMPQSVANKWIHVLHPCLQKALTVLEAILARTAEELKLQISVQQVYFQDGTERANPMVYSLEIIFVSFRFIHRILHFEHHEYT